MCFITGAHRNWHGRLNNCQALQDCHFGHAGQGPGITHRVGAIVGAGDVTEDASTQARCRAPGGEAECVQEVAFATASYAQQRHVIA